MKKHLKRLAAPRSWPIPRKTHIWTSKPIPGPHPQEGSLPLLTLIRDVLHLSDFAREGRMIIGSGSIHVDGRRVTQAKFPVGLMDSVSVLPTKTNYRILLDKNGKFRAVPIPAAEAKWKLCRIQNKLTVDGGKFQLSLHDGRCILLAKTILQTGTTLKISVPEQKVLEALPLEAGQLAYLTGGRHVGEIATIQEVVRKRSPRPNEVVFQEGFTTIKDYVFVVGKSKPEIPLPESPVVI